MVLWSARRGRAPSQPRSLNSFTQTSRAAFITRAAEHVPNSRSFPASPYLPPSSGHKPFLSPLLQGWSGSPGMFSVHGGPRSNGILLDLRANSRNDSIPSQGAVGQSRPWSLSYLWGRDMRSLVGHYLPRLQSIGAPLPFYDTVYKHRPPACPRLHTCHWVWDDGNKVADDDHRLLQRHWVHLSSFHTCTLFKTG